MSFYFIAFCKHARACTESRAGTDLTEDSLPSYRPLRGRCVSGRNAPSPSRGLPCRAPSKSISLRALPGRLSAEPGRTRPMTTRYAQSWLSSTRNDRRWQQLPLNRVSSGFDHVLVSIIGKSQSRCIRVKQIRWRALELLHCRRARHQELRKTKFVQLQHKATKANNAQLELQLQHRKTEIADA